ncbi:MAG: fibronectin/fibrinogen-binding protein [Clostridiales bacterium]|nr:fibronectin/fibrinogen-binding protein [Clostridiales bacterium]
MALDGIFLHNLITDISPIIIDSKIDKINQPEKDEIIINIRKDRKNYKLLISSSPNFPRIHFTNINKPNPLKAPMFTMVLRKYLMGGRILNISQINGDRIIEITIEVTDEMGFNSIYSLMVEIMGRHSNITLIRNRDNKVMDSIKHISADINSYRVIFPGVTYMAPPSKNKINPYNYTFNDFKNKIESDNLDYNKDFYFNIFTGFSKVISKYLYDKNKNLSLYNLEELYNYINNFINSLNENTAFNIYIDDKGAYKDFYSQSITNTTNNTISFNNPSEMLDEFYSTKDKQDRLSNKSSNLQKLIHTNIERCLKKEGLLKSTLTECSKKEDYKIKGDLLTSFIYSIKKGDKSIRLNNFYSEGNEEITISLDENKSPSENVQWYYKKYNKLKKSEEMAKEQLIHNSSELEYLTSVHTNIINAESYDEIEEIKNELIETEYIRARHTNKKKNTKKEGKPLHFISSSGIDIFVGKNNMQNDYLSLKFAHKNDTWLHTKNIPGSHVIIRSDKVDNVTLEEAAIIAAYYSKNKTNSKVPVDYTEVKNLKKPNGAKPGMVIYYTNKTVFVDPNLYSSLKITKL